MKHLDEQSLQEKAKRMVDALFVYLSSIPGFSEEFEEIGPDARTSIHSALERIVLRESRGIGFANMAQNITKQFLADLTHRPGLRQGFFDAMESEDRGNLVKEVFTIVLNNR